jgi:murein biosynthesis integral membrane protein MurJ
VSEEQDIPERRTAEPGAASTAQLGRASLVMAAGTVLSRATGFVRTAVIAATLGVGLTADLFNIANGIPTTVYLLVAGGVLNAVLVPQLVRAIRHDPDGGEAYAQRLSTAVIGVLLVATVLLVAFAPAVVRLFLDPRFLEPELAPQFEATVAFARFCLPQVFFYGLFTLLGQILNAHQRFGPMMVAPVLNNVIAIGVFGGFLAVYGPLDPTAGEYTPGQVAWFGIGSTLGIAAQALVLLPLLRRVGVRLRVRRDLRGVGLGKAARLGVWTLALIGVLQLTTIVVTRLATSAVAADGGGAGFSVYSNAFLVLMVPHSIITVSVATALLPTLSDLASIGDQPTLRARLEDGLRLTLTALVPAAALMAALAPALGSVLFGYGAAAQSTVFIERTLVAFAPGLVGLTILYVLQRGFYAYEDTRTPFLVQVLVSVVQIGVALVVVTQLPPDQVAIGLAGCWSLALLVGAAVCVPWLQRRVGRLRVGSLLWLLLRLAVASAAAGAVVILVTRPAGATGGPFATLLVGGALGVVVFATVGWLLRVRELADVAGLVTSRLRRT